MRAFLDRVLWWVILSFAIIIPLFISPRGYDVFRLPKELLLRMEAILVGSALGLKLLIDKNTFRSLVADRLTATAVIAIATVVLLTTALSTNRPLSTISLGYVIACIIVFCGTYIVVASQTLKTAVLVGTGSAVANGLLAIAQRLNWWNPFRFEEWLPHRMRTSALIGNPNDVGAYLAICAVPLITFAIVRRRRLAAVTSGLLLIAVVAADALTAMLAVLAASITIALLMPRRVAWFSIITLAVIAITAVVLLPPLRARGTAMIEAARAHNYDALTSHRIIGFHAAGKIFLDHPLTGAGPGTFKWHYLPYRVRVELDHPQYYLKSPENLGEVHSDHLQVLAEEGLIGYVSFLFGAAVVGSRSWALRNANRNKDDRVQFARLGALPLTVCFLVLAATGFPLELTAVIVPLLFFTACILRWSLNAART